MVKKIVLIAALLFSGSYGMSLSKLNSASKEELMQINGIGEKKAAAIVKARKKGKFKSYEDLISRVDGIGAQTAANIKNDIKAGDKVKKIKKASSKKTKSVKKEMKHQKDSLKKKAKKKDSKAKLPKKSKKSASSAKKKAKKTSKK